MNLLAVDPGPTQSAYVVLDTETRMLAAHGKLPNRELLARLDDPALANHAVIEAIASYGMPVGAETFETCVWIGRFVERWAAGGLSPEPDLMFRREVKMHLCGSARAKDPHVRQALIDRYGPGKDLAIGRKATPGPLYGVKTDAWAALGVAVTYADTVRSEQETAA